MTVCSALLSACERDLDQTLRFVDDMHSSGYSHSPDFYAKLLERYASLGCASFSLLHVHKSSGTVCAEILRLY